MARPPFPEGTARSKSLPVRLTPSMRLALEQRAKDRNVTLSDYVRDVLDLLVRGELHYKPKKS